MGPVSCEERWDNICKSVCVYNNSADTSTCYGECETSKANCDSCRENDGCKSACDEGDTGCVETCDSSYVCEVEEVADDGSASADDGSGASSSADDESAGSSAPSAP